MTDHPYIDTVEHRAAIYALHSVPEMREWAKQDFLEWLERHDRNKSERIRVLEETLANIEGAVQGWEWLPERSDVLSYIEETR